MQTEISVHLSLTFGDDVTHGVTHGITHDQSRDVRHLCHMKTSSMMSRMLRDDVVTCDACHLLHVMISSIMSCTLRDDDIMSCNVCHLRHFLNFSPATTG